MRFVSVRSWVRSPLGAFSPIQICFHTQGKTPALGMMVVTLLCSALTFNLLLSVIRQGLHFCFARLHKCSCRSFASCFYLCSEKRQRGDSNPCGQSPMDFKSISLTTRTQCLWIFSRIAGTASELSCCASFMNYMHAYRYIDRSAKYVESSRFPDEHVLTLCPSG